MIWLEGQSVTPGHPGLLFYLVIRSLVISLAAILYILCRDYSIL